MDIIICTYNNAKLLDRVLTKLSLQKLSSNYQWTVAVVDNNCTDDTTDIVEKHINAQLIPSLRRIVEKKQGLTYARLCGVNNTTSEWIAFVDDDCILSEDWVDKAIKFATSHSNCGVFGGKVILDWEIPPSETLVKYSSAYAAFDLGESAKQLSYYHLPGAGLVVRRQALEKSGWLDRQFLSGRNGTKLSAGDDSEIVLRCKNAGYELWYTPDCVLYHYIPVKRISETYLINMYYGFGMSLPYIIGIRWTISYLLWIALSILYIVRSFLKTIACSITTATGFGSKTDIFIIWNFTKGQIDSFLSILTMNYKERAVRLQLFK
ncbi:MAG: glycosyltransferase [Nostoc sp.]